MVSNADFDVEALITELSLEEKVGLLAGSGRCSTTGVKRLNIPSLNTSDGPHGLRGHHFWNGLPGCMLPCATAMGSTFDVDLLQCIGELLGDEARGKNLHVVLGPVACLQRSPLIGRGFEAFGEDPYMSGTLAAAYIDGIQGRQVAACIKHYAAHDQSFNSIEDNVVMTERTLREMHVLPFQIAIRKSNPWAIMSSYNKINGLHASENQKLLHEILRDDLEWDGVVMSDWWGTYSTTEAILAGLDLEMPGPPIWRGKALTWAVQARKLSMQTIDTSVRNVLNLIKKVCNPGPSKIAQNNDNAETRSFTRRVAAESIVLLKNNKSLLPLAKRSSKTYGLIGDHFKNPAYCGGGSSEIDPYYLSTPLDAIVEALGGENVEYQVGCYSHKFTPLITSGHTVPGSKDPGFLVEFFGENPHKSPHTPCLFSTVSLKSCMPFNDSIPLYLPEVLFIRIRTTYTAATTGKYRFGLSISGKAKLYLNGENAIDLWTDLPQKTSPTPVLNSFSMERFVDLVIKTAQTFDLEILLTNDSIDKTLVGAVPAPGVRLGVYEVIDEDKTIADAIELAKRVDVPIVITGLSSDYEYENVDRMTLSLPGRVNELIEGVLDANPNTIVITQSGLPIAMPWVDKANSLLHAWFGGQETGHGIADVLFGDVIPSAKLSVTFPKRVEDTPTYLTFGKADRNILYGEGIFIGYRYYEMIDRAPLFYFGYGLSYTQFKYSNLVVPMSFEAREDYIMNISVDVANVGKRDGSEVVQVYVRDVDSTLQRPRKELKAFAKTKVMAGQKQNVVVKLDKYAVSYWSEEHGQWMAEAGKFRVIVATSADPQDEVLSDEFELSETFFWSGR